ncbi:MAG: retropepsin-like aspartic protease [Vulcanimicrobiaceae bacterium]
MLAAPLLAAVLPVIAPAHDGGRAPRYLRMQLAVVVYGVRGTGELLIDRATGRFVRRLDAGPASEREGWDGERAWRADPSGMPRIEGNLDQRDAIRAFADAFVRLPPGARVERAADGTERVRIPDVARGIDVVRDPVSGLVTAIVRYPGATRDRTSFADQRIVDDLVVPFALTDVSVNGVWHADVVGLTTPSQVAASAFAPPPPPHDTSLAGTTSIALDPSFDLPVLRVRVNGGPPLRFLLDTGGQNVITPAAAARCGLQVVGAGTVDGTGPGLASIQFATARTEQIGGALLRNQPFVVLDLGAALPVDGIVGYEVLARLAARLDLAHHRLDLAPSADAFGAVGVREPFVFDEREPQLVGALDGIAGTEAVDTGNDNYVEVDAPFVRAYDLLRRYHGIPDRGGIIGVGGAIDEYVARAGALRIGAVVVRNVAIGLTTSRRGEETDPSVAMQIGDPVWRRFVVIFDYPNQVIRLLATSSQR